MFILEACTFLIVCVRWIDSELICALEDDTFYCHDDEECCLGGCCSRSFEIPRVSIALVLSICTFILVLCFLCWCIQIVTKIYEKYAFRKGRGNGTAKIVLMDDETIDCDGCELVPPPTYSVAINLPTVRTFEDGKVPTYDEAVKTSQTNNTP